MKQTVTNIHDTSLCENKDEDLCNSLELWKIFFTAEPAVEYIIARNKYILELTASSETEPNVALALSDYSCEICCITNSHVEKIATLKEHEKKLVGCRFSADNSMLVYTGSNDGSIKLWDIRSPGKSSITFTDTTVEDTKTRKIFNCFDISPNNRLLTAGTDIIDGDSYLLFWDLRSAKLLGGYWESHSDDITEVKFHPTDSNKLISGSVDGLINVYNLREPSEDDALLDSLNTESSIQHLAWYKCGNKDNIGCITHTNDLLLYDLDRAEPIKQFQRGEVTRHIMKNNVSYTYIESMLGSTSPIILVGSNANEGECFRALTLKNGDLLPAFIFKNNKQRVRASWYNENVGFILTGGEKGILNMWNVDMKS